ncbi:hypothetical protein GCM10022381_15620 [Leifsonia kafniensis]|uniref:Lipoprotein n=1 Tax=Leifsonia kafniensis TaxID=475957 RepID=A0ABP7KER6_9MICO
MKRIVKAGVLACTFLVLGTLTGCAGARAVGGTSEVLASNCSIGWVLEWDDSPGPDTRSGAIQNQLRYFEERASLFPRDSARSQFSEDDPVRIRVALRGLGSLLDEVPAAEKAIGTDEDMTVTSHLDDGQVLATATVIAMPAGGYRVDSFAATGWVSDDVTCVPDELPTQ